jgi:hypothetical protein
MCVCVLVIFQIASQLFAQVAAGCNPATYASDIAGVSGIHHHT